MTHSIFSTQQRTFSIFALIATLQLSAGIGDSISQLEIRVTLLEARRLSFEEYREARKPLPADWNGGGFRFVLLVENRAGAPAVPGLGDIRGLIDSRPYNAVVNANSAQPFPPLVVVRGDVDYFHTAAGQKLNERTPPYTQNQGPG